MKQEISYWLLTLGIIMGFLIGISLSIIVTIIVKGSECLA